MMSLEHLLNLHGNCQMFFKAAGLRTYPVFYKNNSLHYLSYLCQTATDVQNSLANDLAKKFATVPPLNFPPYL